MSVDCYSVESNKNHTRYEFFSTGPKGSIFKIVQFSVIKANVFNLSFGDWDEENQEINDDARSNNLDRTKVLATVASTVSDFISRNPTAVIYAQGLTPSRTRLYQMSIRLFWEEINERFYIRGYINGKWEFFKTGKNYEAFALNARQKM